MSLPDFQELMNLLEPEGIDAVTLTAQLIRDNPSPVAVFEESDFLKQAILVLLVQSNRDRQAALSLAFEHDQLRNEYAQAQGRAHRANDKISKAAVKHRDTTLAAVARNLVYGRPRREALDVMPTGISVLKQFLRLSAAHDSVELLNLALAIDSTYAEAERLTDAGENENLSDEWIDALSRRHDAVQALRAWVAAQKTVAP